MIFKLLILIGLMKPTDRIFRRKYIPGYKITVPPQIIDNKRLFSSALIKGSGDYLPDYAGNLDIIFIL